MQFATFYWKRSMQEDDAFRLTVPGIRLTGTCGQTETIFPNKKQKPSSLRKTVPFCVNKRKH